MRRHERADLEPRLYRRHAADPPLRGARLPPVPRRRDPGDAAPVPGSGGGRGRRLRRPETRRLDHLDAPAARACAGEGRQRSRRDGRALRQGDRLLRRQGRLDAPGRPGRRHAARDRDRRRRQHRRHRPRAGDEAAPDRPGRRLLLRRGGDERGRLPRRPQLRRGRRGCRSCSSARTTSTAPRPITTTSRWCPDVADRAKAYGVPARIVDGMDVLAVREATAEAVAAARSGAGPGVARVQDLPLHGPQPQRRARLPRTRGGGRVGGARSAAATRRRSSARRRWPSSRQRSRRSSTTRSSSRAARRSPTPADAFEGVYA